MTRTAFHTMVLATALTLAVGAEYLFTDVRPSTNLGPDNPLRADIEDQIVFRNVSARETPAVIAAVERSTRSDFTGLLFDLENASVSNVSYNLSQNNVPVRFSTARANRTCYTFLNLSLTEPPASRVTLRGKTTDGGDRSDNSGNFEFELTSSSALKLGVTLDPGPSGALQDCLAEFWVGESKFTISGLSPATFQLNANKRGLFRFSKSPGAGANIRLNSMFEASDVLINRPDGTVRSHLSSAIDGQPISVRELVIRPGAIESSLSGKALLAEPGLARIVEWAGQNSGRLMLYGALDLSLIALLIRRARTRKPVARPDVEVSMHPSHDQYVFISYERTDRQLVRRIVDDLRLAGVDARYDDHLRAGDRWAQELQTLIARCSEFIVLMTPESTASEFVTKEIRLAQETGRRVIPVLIRDTHNLLLMDLQHIDARASRDPIPDLLAALMVDRTNEQLRNTAARA